MRILFACTGYAGHGGIQRYNRNLVRALLDLGAEVDVIALVDSQDDANREMNRSQGLSIVGARRDKLSWTLQVLKSLAFKRYAYCVCGHINLAALMVVLLIATGYPSGKRFLILHGIEVWGRVSGLKASASRRFGKVLPVSSYTGDSFLEQVRDFPRSLLTIFPNTISPDVAMPAPRSRDQPQDEPLRLLSVTRLAATERDKGILHVLEALHELKDRIAFTYTIVGDGDDRSFMVKRAKELGLEDRVAFRGAVSDAELWTAYEDANVFVLPSRKEGFGIVFLEAMRFALPIIAAEEKGAVDVVRQGLNGLMVKFGDVGGLSSRIVALSNDRALREQLGEAGRSLVAHGGEFSYESFRERTRMCFPGVG